MSGRSAWTVDQAYLSQRAFALACSPDALLAVCALIVSDISVPDQIASTSTHPVVASATVVYIAVAVHTLVAAGSLAPAARGDTLAVLAGLSRSTLEDGKCGALTCHISLFYSPDSHIRRSGRCGCCSRRMSRRKRSCPRNKCQYHHARRWGWPLPWPPKLDVSYWS